MEVQETCSETLVKVLTTSRSLSPSLQASIDKIIKKEGYITHKVFNRAISTSGGNYMADLYEVDIKGKTGDGDKETNIFIKNKIEDSQMKIIDVAVCYYMENFFYGELSNVYAVLQEKANIPVEERYAMAKSYDATNPDAIILENLTKKGFTTIHRMDVVSLKFAELAVQQLARFHGLSWALERQRPEYFAKKIKNIKATFVFGDDYQSFIDNMSIYTHKGVDENLKPKLNKFKSGILDKMTKYYYDNAGAKCCLCHGDYRANNILMKKDGDDITEVIPVDYQILYFGCPINDFVYFIFISTDQDFRTKHLNNLKDLYHNSLAKFLKYFDMDVESVYPRHEFEAQYTKRLDFGLIVTLIFMPLLFTEDGDVPNINKEDMGAMSITPNAKMDERIRGVVDDFLKWGLL